MAIFDSLISPLIDAAKGIISEFHASPEEKQAALEKMAQLQQQAIQDARDYQSKLNEIAGQNIRADATSSDHYTSRARPTFMYIIETILAFNYIVIPLAGIFGSHYLPINLPADLLTLFGVCVTGYVFNRTAEKVAAMPGDSQVSVLGMKIGNKS